MGIHGRVLAAVAGLVVLAPAHAWGADTKAVQVAQDGAVRLAASQQDGQLCLTVTVGGEEHSLACAGSTDSGVVLTADRGAGLESLAAAVPATATTVEVRREGQLLATGPTVAGEAYRATRAGSVRFALVRLPRGAPEDGLRVRALDAGGMVRETLASDPGEIVSEERRLLSGRTGRTSWTITSQRSSSLRSTVVDLDHESVSRCVSVTTPIANGSISANPCFEELPPDSVPNLARVVGEPSAADSCKPAFRLVYGITDGPMRRISVLLGDGRRVTARTAQVPSRPQVVYALAVRASAAVRSVRLEPADGPPRVVTLALAPLRVLCANRTEAEGIDLTSRLDDPPLVFPPGPVAAVASTPPLRVADGPAETMCLGLGDAPFTVVGCHVVSPYLSSAKKVFDNSDEPRAFAVALPAAVATMRISAKRGVARDIATISADDYRGRYAGHVRFAVAAITSTRELARVQYLDGAGRLLFTEPANPFAEFVDALDQRTFPVRRLIGRAGQPSLWQTTSRTDGEISRCLTLTDGPAPGADAPCQERGPGLTALLAASCATHRLTVGVGVRAGARVIARLGNGRARVLALRNGAALLTLAPGTGLRSLSLVRRGRPARTLSMNAPAGARQCGWQAALTR